MADARRHSPLGSRSAIEAPDGAISLREQPFRGKAILRCDAGAASAVVKKVTGASLPVEPNSVSHSNETLILWLGPDEWMLLSSGGAHEALLVGLSKALEGKHHQLVDVSDQHCIIELAGIEARALLMKLTTLDLHPGAFQAGQVAGLLLGHAAATLSLADGRKKDAAPCFEIVVRRSFADYLWCLLADAGREFGLPQQEPRAGETMRS